MRAILFSALMLAACAQPGGGPAADPLPASLPEHVRMDLEQREAALAAPGIVVARIDQRADLGGGLIVTPREVLEDSRCPQNARCIWAGRLRVRVSVQGDGDREITLGEGAVTTPRGSFTLEAVSPGKWTDWPAEGQPALPYRFGFKRG